MSISLDFHFSKTSLVDNFIEYRVKFYKSRDFFFHIFHMYLYVPGIGLKKIDLKEKCQFRIATFIYWNLFQSLSVIPKF